MALGTSFPPSFLELQIRRNLVPGAVINSEISAFLLRRPALLKCQVSMPAASHPFMNHDSHVDCSRTRVYNTRAVIGELIFQPDWILGAIDIDLRDNIVAALKFASTLTVKEVAQLCNSLAGLS